MINYQHKDTEQDVDKLLKDFKMFSNDHQQRLVNKNDLLKMYLLDTPLRR